MLVSVLVPVAFLGFLSFVAAQNSTAFQAFLNDLRTFNASGMANLTAASSDVTFQLGITSNNPKTLFVPNDDAIASALISNVAGLLLYLVAPGNWTISNLGVGANHSILPTLLSGNQLSFLEADKPQVLACGDSHSNGQIEVYNQAATTLVLDTKVNTELNIIYHIVNRVIDIPGSYTNNIDALGASTVSQWSNLQQEAGFSNDSIDNLQGFTVFAFSNDAYQQALSHVGNVTSFALFKNHFISGETIWYNTFTSQTWKSAAGNEFTFTLDPNTLDYTVGVGQSSGLITHSDVLAQNGVIHVIDGVLWDVVPTPTNTGTSVTGTTTGSTDQEQNAATSSKSPLSGGAIAGIVLACIAAILLVLIAFICWRRRPNEPANHPASAQAMELSAAVSTAHSWSGNTGARLQPNRFYGTETSSSAAYGRDEFSESGVVTAAPLHTSKYTDRDRDIATSPGGYAHSQAETQSDTTFYRDYAREIPEEVVDHLLERFAARIDTQTYNAGAEPPLYRG